MNGSNEGDKPVAEENGQVRQVSRRKVIVAGALMAPVLLTMRVPTASAGGNRIAAAVSPPVSCKPAGAASRRPDQAICDGKPDGDEGLGAGGGQSFGQQGVDQDGNYGSRYEAKSQEDFKKYNLGWDRRR